MNGTEEAVKAMLARVQIMPDAEHEAREFQEHVKPLLAGAGWEERFRDRLELTGAQTKVLEKVRGYLAPHAGAIVALVGPRGLGKTTLASTVAIDKATHFWRYYSRPPEQREVLLKPTEIPVYRKMAKLVTRFKTLYADFGSIDTEALAEAKERLCNCALLVIDELHECEEIKIMDRILTDIVDVRYARIKDTILISNQTAADFKNTMNDSIISRLSQHGDVIQCGWKTFRTKL